MALLFEPGRIRRLEVRNLIRITSMTSRAANAPAFLARSDTRRTIRAEQPIAPTAMRCLVEEVDASV